MMREVSILVPLGAALVLFALMLVIGLELSLDDFRRVFRHPRAVWVGTLGQLCALPLASVLFLRAADASPSLTAGVVLIASTPGAGMSNVFTYLAGAHTALSVTLTAVASALAAVSLPVLMALSMRALGTRAEVIDVPVLALGGQLIFLVLLPIGLGMHWRSKHPESARRHAPRLRAVTLALVIGLITFSVGTGESDLLGEVPKALWLAFCWTAMAMLLGYGIAALAGLDADDRFTIGIELAAKNVGLSAIVALTALDSPELLIFAGAYQVVGYPLVLGLSLARRRLRGRVHCAPEQGGS
jgi:BASS family bile acid:Na+ symporter